jgi:acetylornithine deacetylase
MATHLSPHFTVKITDYDNGCVNVFATRGNPRVLLTAHLDTVPVTAGWTRDPFSLTVEGGRAYGLGACDIKGGAAAMVASALEEGSAAALLFTTDEEAGTGACVRGFLAEKRNYELVVVAEPTRCKAVRNHRGIGTGTLEFTGRGAHSSVAGASAHSAIHHMTRWASAALELDKTLDETLSGGNVTGTRFNIGRVSGGEKTNMIADMATARFGIRPPPGVDPSSVLRDFATIAPGATYTENFFGPALPAAGIDPSVIERSEKWALAAGLEDGGTVDFWTEASLFSEAGYATFVLGPGDIMQAHAADEYVDVVELERAVGIYRTLLRGDGV